jgi:hypothetical protein
MKLRIASLGTLLLLAVGAAVTAGALALYLRRKLAADAAAPVQLGAQEGLTHDLKAGDPGVAAIQAAAAQVRGSFQLA